MNPVRSVDGSSKSFEDLVTDAATELSSAARELTVHLPETISRAVDLERALKLERKLSWQVFRLSRSADLSEIGNVPSLSSALKVVEAARGRGVPEPVVSRVRAAFEQFDRLAIEHCGDRAGMMSMVSGLAHARSESRELSVRKSLFRNNAHAWGLQAGVQVRTVVYVPGGPREETLRGLLVSGNIDLRGLRRGEPMVISSWVTPHQSEAAASRPPGSDEAAGNARSTPNFTLLRDFCSVNLPAISHREGPSGLMETEMLIPVTGRSGAVTLYLTQESPTAGDAREHGAGAGMFVSVPAEEVVIELLVPAGYSAPSSARVVVFGRRHHPERAREERATDLLPQTESVSYLGRVTNAPPIAGAPFHQAAVRATLEKNGLFGREFDMYRCQVRYPLLHSFVVMRVDGYPSNRPHR